MDIENNHLIEFQNLSKDDPDFSKKCSQLVEDIKEGSYTFVSLVERLKGFLVDPVPTSRELGMLILTHVLEKISYDQISPTQLKFVCDFYIERLKDHHQVVPPTLKGILALLKFRNLPEGQTGKFLHFIFQNVPCQQQQQHDRLNVYTILQVSLENSLSEVQAMGYDFIYGVIMAIEGERDPRNLLFLFDWLPKFFEKFTLGHLSEEMFEVLACYFPIDFRMPTQEANSISRQTLAVSLSNCLCATSEFAEYCLPLVLEKLSSSLRIAKLDSLDVLAKGCASFASSFYVQHSTDIWSQIQREVLNSNDDELEKLALETFVTVMSKLSQNSDSVYKPIISDIVDTLKGNLLPNMKLFLPSCKMLHHLCKSSKVAATFTIAEAVPIMVNTYHITLTPTHRVLILNNLANFVRVYTEVYQNFDITENSHLLLVPCLCFEASLHENDEVRAAGLRGLAFIAKSIPLDVRMCLYKRMCTLIISRQPSIRVFLLELLERLGETYGDESQTHILNQIQINSPDELDCYLEALAKIVHIETFTHDVLDTFVRHCQSDFNTAQIAINRLRHLLEECSGNDRILRYLGENLQIVFSLTDFVLNYVKVLDIGDSNHEQLLGNVSRITKIILSHQSKEAQLSVISKCDALISSYRSCQNVALIIVIDGLIACLRSDVRFQPQIVPDLLYVALRCDDESVRTIANRLLANMLNKMEDDENLENDLKLIEDRLNLNTDKIDRIIGLLSRTTKGLLMRGHRKGADWTMKLVRLLDEHQEAAKGFEIIMKQNCPTLSAESFCNIKFLYRQKFFVEIVSLLKQNNKTSNENYLLAFGYVLKEAPRPVIIMEFKKIIPMVLSCLERCENGEILLVVLETLCDLIKNKEAVTAEYLQELLSRAINLSTFKSSMMVRIKALECVQHFAIDYPVYKLLPLKQEVIQKLSLCLDDKKRLVRKAAVEARLSWIMLDALT